MGRSNGEKRPETGSLNGTQGQRQREESKRNLKLKLRSGRDLGLWLSSEYRADGSRYARRSPNTYSVLYLKDILVLFKHSLMKKYLLNLHYMRSIVFSTTDTP